MTSIVFCRCSAASRCSPVTPDFSRPAKPTDNAFIESFNARLRQELLNASWFLSLADARLRHLPDFTRRPRH